MQFGLADLSLEQHGMQRNAEYFYTNDEVTKI